MKIVGHAIVRFCPPDDSFLMLRLDAEGGLSGWGEMTGSGNDRAAVAFAEDALRGLMGGNALDMPARMADFHRYRVPPLRDRCAVTAWSAVNQALWDIAARARGVPLYTLLGDGRRTGVPLYANLNRGLLRDRSVAAFARNAEDALASGFAFAKATPLDEATPAADAPAVLDAAKARLAAIYAAVGTERVAIDGHWRLNPRLAENFMGWQARHGRLYWMEDILDSTLPDATVAEFRHGFPGVTWAGGEDAAHPLDARRLLDGPARPDVFMPDIKHLCGLDVVGDLLAHARTRGCGLSLHNPSGPVSTAFSAHLCAAVAADRPLEFCFRAVPGRERLTTPVEPTENGTYFVPDAPGIGIVPSADALERFGTTLSEGSE